MNLDELRTFVTVAESGSIKRAAQEVHLSQPTITRHIQRLETALGAQLFDRRAKPVTLTSIGQVAIVHARHLLQVADEFRAAIAGSEGPAGACRIGIAHALADTVLAEPIDRLQRAFPLVTFRVVAGWSRTLLDQLRAGSLDAAVAQLESLVQPPSEVTGQIVGTQSLVVVASRRRRLPKLVNLHQLADETWVMNPDGCGFRSVLQRALQRINAPLRVVVEAYGLELQLSLVARNVGMGLIPARVLTRSRLRSHLQVARVKGYDFRLVIWSLRGRHSSLLTPALDVLDEELKRVLGGNSGNVRPPVS